jgi:hypothetical protein
LEFHPMTFLYTFHFFPQPTSAPTPYTQNSEAAS